MALPNDQITWTQPGAEEIPIAVAEMILKKIEDFVREQTKRGEAVSQSGRVSSGPVAYLQHPEWAPHVADWACRRCRLVPPDAQRGSGTSFPMGSSFLPAPDPGQGQTRGRVIQLEWSLELAGGPTDLGGTPCTEVTVKLAPQTLDASLAKAASLRSAFSLIRTADNSPSAGTAQLKGRLDKFPMWREALTPVLHAHRFEEQGISVDGRFYSFLHHARKDHWLFLCVGNEADTVTLVSVPDRPTPVIVCPQGTAAAPRDPPQQQGWLRSLRGMVGLSAKSMLPAQPRRQRSSLI